MKTILLLVALLVGVYAQFSPSAQQAIVDHHNRLRSKIAKGQYNARGTQKETGSNILKLKWDSAIADSAQRYANTCANDHSHWPGFGENLFWFWVGNPGDLNQYGTQACDGWEKEYADFGWKYNKLDMALFNTGIGHATAMSWARTGRIGCGVKNCGRDSNGLIKVMVVCQYKNQGNMINTNIYNTGATCSACPSGTSCEQSTGLCQ